MQDMQEEQDHNEDATVPEADYFGKATDLMSSYDRLLVSLYSSLIAGVILLLLYKQVSAWVGAFFLLALVLFIFGIAHTLLHMTFHTKMLLAMEAMINGTDYVPNAVEGEEPTAKAYARMQRNAQRAYTGQLYYLLFGVLFGGVAVVVHLWHHAWRAMLVVAVLLGLLMAAALAVRVWRQPKRGES